MGEKVHSLTNVITMDHCVHDEFDQLDLYFEATVSLTLDFFDNTHRVNV